MISALVAAIAMFRPREIVTPGASITRSGKRERHVWSNSTVESVEPPSTITTSSGGRLWRATESNSTSSVPASLSTVRISAVRSRA
jgi:hypothetical protein